MATPSHPCPPLPLFSSLFLFSPPSTSTFIPQKPSPRRRSRCNPLILSHVSPSEINEFWPRASATIFIYHGVGYFSRWTASRSRGPGANVRLALIPPIIDRPHLCQGLGDGLLTSQIRSIPEQAPACPTLHPLPSSIAPASGNRTRTATPCPAAVLNRHEIPVSLFRQCVILHGIRPSVSRTRHPSASPTHVIASHTYLWITLFIAATSRPVSNPVPSGLRSHSCLVRENTSHLTTDDHLLMAACLFCKIVKGDIPSFKLLETEFSYAFLDINPLATGHALVIPKFHGEKLHDIPDEYLNDTIPVAKKIAIAGGFSDYNILQNNGEIAHQVVKHVHFHVIPKPSATDTEGLVIGWPQQTVTMDNLKDYLESIKNKL